MLTCTRMHTESAHSYPLSTYFRRYAVHTKNGNKSRRCGLCSSSSICRGIILATLGFVDSSQNYRTTCRHDSDLQGATCICIGSAITADKRGPTDLAHHDQQCKEKTQKSHELSTVTRFTFCAPNEAVRNAPEFERTFSYETGHTANQTPGTRYVLATATQL